MIPEWVAWGWLVGWVLLLPFRPDAAALVFLSPLILTAVAVCLFVAALVLGFTVGLPFLLLWAVFFA